MSGTPGTAHSSRAELIVRFAVQICHQGIEVTGDPPAGPPKVEALMGYDDPPGMIY